MTMTKREVLTIWITGASSGIGRSTAIEAASHGHRLILSARNAEQLEEVARECEQRGGRAMVLPCDLSDTKAIPQLVENAWNLLPGGIDILYLNAGISQRCRVEDLEEAMIRRIMELDYFANVLMAKNILPKMLTREPARKVGGWGLRGQIAVTSSICGLFGFPLRSIYSSAKAALYGFFETLDAEYHDQGIAVSIICPGRVLTDISLHAVEKGGTEHGKLDAGQKTGMSAEKAGRIIYKAIIKARPHTLVGGKELLMVYIKRFFPRLCAKLSRKISPE